MSDPTEPRHPAEPSDRPWPPPPPEIHTEDRRPSTPPPRPTNQVAPATPPRRPTPPPQPTNHADPATPPRRLTPPPQPTSQEPPSTPPLRPTPPPQPANHAAPSTPPPTNRTQPSATPPPATERYDLDEHPPSTQPEYNYGAGQDDEAEPDDSAGTKGLPDLVGGASPLTRRRFVQGLVATGVAGAGIFAFTRPSGTPDRPKGEDDTASPSSESDLGGQGSGAAPTDQRVLVLIELEGGNDGLSTVVPRNVGTYYDLRPNLAIPEEELLDFDDELGLSPKLVKLSKQRLTVVEGVGPVNGNLSHFDMVRRWETGDLKGDTNQRSGFLARLVDNIQSDSPMVGLSVSGHTPRFNAAQGSVLSIDDPNQLNTLINDDWIFPSYRNALKSFSGDGHHATMSESWGQLFSIGDALDIELKGFDEKDPMIAEGGSIGRQLLSAAELIKADVGVRVVHVRLGGFDTHDGHGYKHPELLGQVDTAVGGFLERMEAEGLGNRVLVATTSEFGRRVEENSDGFDHGVASTMLLSGPIKTGRLGERPPLDDLDEDGNLKTTIAFDRYLATLAQGWLGVEAAAVLPNDPKPFELF